MIKDLLSTLSSRYRAWMVCAPVLALCLACNESKPLVGELHVVAELGPDAWCTESSPPLFNRLEFRALGHEETWSFTPTDIMKGRGRRELPPGLYTVSVSPAAHVSGNEVGGAPAFVDAPLVSVVASQVTTVTVQGMGAACSLSSRL